MAQTNFLGHHLSKIVVALFLTFASGLVDIVGYLGVFHFFTAHLTGTTVQLGKGLADRDLDDVLAAGTIVGAFLFGSILGRALIEIGSRRKIRRIASLTLTIEAILLAAVAAIRSGLAAEPHWSLAILAASMGVQTATLTGIGPLTVHTTFVTGMVNKMAQLVSHVAFRGYDLRKNKIGDSPAHRAQERAQEEELQMLALLAGIWLLYVLGAVVGAWAFASIGMRALLIAVGLLVIAFAIDQARPFAVQEEKEQSER